MQATPVPHLQNVVVTFHIGVDKIDLRHLASTVPWVEYDPRKFAAATMRLARPRSTCLLFGSGRGVCTGAKTEKEARLAAYSYVCLLRRLGIMCNFRSFRVQNIVCAVHCNFKLDLLGILNGAKGACGYEPELFPGLMYRTDVGKYTMVFLLFKSGKCVITGGRSQRDIVTHWARVYDEIILPHRTANETADALVVDPIEEHNLGLMMNVEPSALLDTSVAPDDWASVVNHLRPEARAVNNLLQRQRTSGTGGGHVDHEREGRGR